MTDLIGQTLGQYRIIEQIGQGGMATVYKAHQPSLDRYVAFKVLPPLHAQTPGFSERFRREAKTIASLNHPNILPAYDFGQVGPYSFITMRYVNQVRTLKEIMADQLSLDQIENLISQVAAALDYAHRQGVIHRDVKPSNILMDGDWALLSDFGLAKMMETSVQLTGTGVGIGTPAYMSPEQGIGQAVNHQTDIYALGIIIFEMLTGQIPHFDKTPIAIIIKRSKEPLPLPRSLNPAISESVERVVLKALAPDPINRFDRAMVVAERLKTAVNQSVAATKQPTILAVDRDTILTEVKLKSPGPAKSEIPFGQMVTKFSVSSKENRQEQRNRQAMLELVKDFWIKGVLESSLHGAVWLELGMEKYAEAVRRPWNTVLQMPKLPSLPIPPGTSIREVFTTLGESLLILGEPGSGKTTMLLELVRETIILTEADPTQPIPVVFNLSSWTGKMQFFADWLVEELNTKYSISKKIAGLWVKNDALLLFLDGLDEVAVEWREACVQAINAFHQEHFAPIVVCSRIADYENLITVLKFQGGIVLQPLTPQQVEFYLDQAGLELAAIRKMLQEDATLKELIQSPLMLSVISLAYQELSDDIIAANTSIEKRQYLLNAYVRQMFERRGVKKHYTSKKTVCWLGWLAKRMSQDSQTVFLIEQMQPSWLSTRMQRWVYVLSSRIIQALSISLTLALTTGVSEGRLTSALILGVAGGLGLGVAQGILFERKVASDGKTIPPGWVLAITVFMVRLVVGLSAPLSGKLMNDVLVFGVVDVLISGVIFGLIFGVRGQRQSLTNDVLPSEALYWSWGKSLKRGAFGLILGIIFGLISGPIFGFSKEFEVGLINILIDGLIFGIIGMLVGSIFGGLKKDIIRTKISPNQSIRLSLRNAILTGLILGVIGGLAVGLIEWFIINRINVITLGSALFGQSGGLIFVVLGVGLFGSLWFGGFDVIQHYTLRLILIFKGYIPRRYIHFLDYAAERTFLQKVGGGYIFIHRLLMDHFAKMNIEKKQFE